jgi:hypothetical protein
VEGALKVLNIMVTDELIQRFRTVMPVNEVNFLTSKNLNSIIEGGRAKTENVQ